MSPSGKRKAALLLLALDPASAAELLKSARPDMVQELVAEVAHLNASGSKKNDASAAPAREFCTLLARKTGAAGQKERFLQDMLDGALGAEKSRALMARIGDLVQDRDPFIQVRSLPVEDLAKALRGESPQVAALVLADLPAKKSADLLGLLEEKVRLEAVRGMAAGEEASADVRKRVADLVLTRLAAPSMKSEGRKDQQLRKVAILLRGLGSDLRSSLIQSMVAADKEVGQAIQRLMVTWEDITSIADRSLQEVLRGMESKKLAMALMNADAAVVAKLRTNMSERAAAMLDEETSLLSNVKPTDVEKSREAVLNDLRELNANNMLNFVDG